MVATPISHPGSDVGAEVEHVSLGIAKIHNASVGFVPRVADHLGTELDDPSTFRIKIIG